MTNPLLELQSVSKKVKGHTILFPLSLSLGRGQVVALAGGNGAGKSTLLRMIAGISQPSSGTIVLDGIDGSRKRTSYTRKIGYMPDDFQFHPNLTAWETIRFYEELRGAKKKTAVQVLEQTGLLHAMDQFVGEFSKGMRQRLLFAQALLDEPLLLILDEPTNGLDPYWIQTFGKLLQDLKQAGTSIIFSTHHLPLAEATADEIILMHSGKVLHRGSTDHFKKTFGNSGLTGAFLQGYTDTIRDVQ